MNMTRISRLVLLFFCVVIGFLGTMSSAALANGLAKHSLQRNRLYASPHISHGIIVRVVPGSLQDNIERIAHRFGWRSVVWKAESDYHWVGYANIQGQDLEEVMGKILDGYPLQAVFYAGNHVLVIQARTLK
jgi:hypothetical protein